MRHCVPRYSQGLIGEFEPSAIWGKSFYSSIILPIYIKDELSLRDSLRKIRVVVKREFKYRIECVHVYCKDGRLYYKRENLLSVEENCFKYFYNTFYFIKKKKTTTLIKSIVLRSWAGSKEKSM